MRRLVLIGAAVAALASLTLQAQAISWQEGSGKSCSLACQNRGGGVSSDPARTVRAGFDARAGSTSPATASGWRVRSVANVS